MKLGEKIRYLRLVEGTLRGMGREMTQQDLARALKKELGAGLSQSYLSQIESGARPHLTNSSRMMLARFFKVHPGYLVDDPEGYHTELTSDLRAMQDRLDLWLIFIFSSRVTALTTSCCVISRPWPRRFPSISLR